MHQLYEHTTGFDDAHMDDLLHGLVQDVEQGYVKRLAIVIPAPMPWPLPAYELALMASERAWDMGADMDITVLTPETSPLEIFGTKASHDLSQLLSERRIDVVTSAYCEVPKAKTIVVHPGGKSLEADRIVSLPSLSGPRIVGLPQDGNGFIPIDEFGRVVGVESVWAAGDATDYPVKQGGVAAQLADVSAGSIAAAVGIDLEPQPFDPTLEGVLLTGGTPRRLRELAGGHLGVHGGAAWRNAHEDRGALPESASHRSLALSYRRVPPTIVGDVATNPRGADQLTLGHERSSSLLLAAAMGGSLTLARGGRRPVTARQSQFCRRAE